MKLAAALNRGVAEAYPRPFANEILRGLTYLDAHYQDWRQRIDVDSLDIRSQTACILGQLTGHFHRAFRAYTAAQKVGDAEARAFFASMGFTFNKGEVGTAWTLEDDEQAMLLNEAWKVAIRAEKQR